MVVLRNRKNTQEHQIAFIQAKAKAKADAKAAMLAEAEAETKAKATKVQDWIVASAEAKAEPKAKANTEAEAEPMTKAEYNAYMSLARANALQHLNSRADEILSKQSVGLSTVSKLVEDYRIAGLPVPAFLISTIVNGVKKLPTMVYPQVKPCVCATNFRYGQDAWFDEHLRSGKCTAYKMYQ